MRFMIKVCPYCKKEFITRKSEQICCSKSCAAKLAKPEDIGLFRKEVPDNIKKYIIGLITTDGCITGSLSTYIVISLKDKYLIEMIRDIVCPTKNIYKDGTNFQVKWRNERDVRTLNELQITRRKTFTCEFILYDLNIWDYVRGIFDGDGCAYYSTSNGYKFVFISFSTASINFAKKLNDFLNDNGIESKIYPDCRNREMYYVKIFKKKSVILFKNKIYSYHTKWKLDRKYEILNNYNDDVCRTSTKCG